MIKTAMVMAAGHGTRMRHLTEDRSKAMVGVGGKPLIDHTLDRLVAAGVERAVVNVHAHADHLESRLAGRRDIEIIISDERELLLETGGGVVKALPLLGDDPVFVCNIDACWVEWEPVLPALLRAWDAEAMDELFLLAPREHCLGFNGKGDFEIEGGKLVRRRGETAPWVYAGVEIFKPRLAKSWAERYVNTELAKRAFSRNRIWDETLARGRVAGVPIPGYWMHVGDPDARRAAEAVLAAT